MGGFGCPDDRRAHARLREQPRDGDLRRSDAAFAGDRRDRVDHGLVRFAIEPVAGHDRVRASRTCAAAARQQPTADRAVRDQAHAFLAAQRNHFPLLFAIQQAVVVLHADEARQAQLVGTVQQLGELIGRHGRSADVAHLAGLDEIGQCLERLLERRFAIETVDLVQIYVVQAEPTETGIDRLEDVLARQAALVRSRSHRVEQLGRNHHLLTLHAEAREGAPENLLALALGVDVGGVEEIDAEIERLAHDCQAGPLGKHPVGAAAEAHASQADT